MAFDFQSGARGNSSNGSANGGSDDSWKADRFVNFNLIDPETGKMVAKLGTLYLKTRDPAHAKLIEQLDAYGELDYEDTKALLMTVLAAKHVGITYKTADRGVSAAADIDFTAGFTPKKKAS